MTQKNTKYETIEIMKNANVLKCTLKNRRIFFKCKFTSVLTSLGDNCCPSGREGGGGIIKYLQCLKNVKFYNGIVAFEIRLTGFHCIFIDMHYYYMYCEISDLYFLHGPRSFVARSILKNLGLIFHSTDVTLSQ